VRGGTLFSGVGAPECAMPWVDWRWCAEIDPFASAVLARRHPDIPNLGDVNEIDGSAVEPVDLIVFGSPCQSFSVAGKRLGLDDPRGNMALVGLRVVGRIRPRWVVWENVPGVLSSDGGRDFGAFLGLLGELGYGFAYRVLDAQHFGVPQRRRRVFVVGCLGDWRGAAAVLFEPESLRGDSAPRRETGQGVARPVASCAPGGSGYRCDADTADSLISIGFGAAGDAGDNVAPTLAVRAGRGHGSSSAVAFGGNNMSGPIDVATACSAHGGPSGRLDFETETLIAFSAKDHGADHGDIAPTLRAGGHDRSHANAGVMPAIAFQANAGRDFTADHDRSPPLRSEGIGGTSGVAIAFDARQSDVLQYGDKSGPFDSDGWSIGIAHSLRADGFDAGEDGTGRGMSVRRLTPRECERLQGLPDDYTLIPYRGKPAADGPRYRAIGNSMAVPVIGWLGERIAAVDEITAFREAAE